MEEARFGRLIGMLWVMLGGILLALLALASWLLIKSEIFTMTPLTDEQAKSVWAFLGVSLGAAVTLIGSLLTEMAGRRSDALARVAERRAQDTAEQELQLAKENAQRLAMDTVSRVLELTTEPGSRARSAGALATLIAWQGGNVSVRILNDLWEEGRLSSSAATWLVDRVLVNPDDVFDESDKEEAALALVQNADRLVPSPSDARQEWFAWPKSLYSGWPTASSMKMKNSLVFCCIRTLQAREPEWWVRMAEDAPLVLLWSGLEDEGIAGDACAMVLARVYATPALNHLHQPSASERKKYEGRAVSSPGKGFLQLLDGFSAWAEGKSPGPTQRTPNDATSSISVAAV